jgi:hypothetical protein
LGELSRVEISSPNFNPLFPEYSAPFNSELALFGYKIKSSLCATDINRMPNR